MEPEGNAPAQTKTNQENELNAEQIAKLKDAASRVNQFYDPSQASSEDLTTIMNELPELLALAERTTSPVSQMTDEQIDAIWKNMPGFDVKDGVELREFAKAKRTEFARAILAAAAPHAQAPVAESVICSTCNGAGVVDDGEIDCYSNGEPFVNGPVKCVKDCPDCAAQPQPAAELPAPVLTVEIFRRGRAERHQPNQNYYTEEQMRTAIAASQHHHVPATYPWPERDQSKPAEQQGLFRKFEVRRVDGSDQPGGKHFGCHYFVLDMVHDAHAPAAIRAYAASCRATHPELAQDIEDEWGAASQQAAEPVAWRTEFIVEAAKQSGLMRTDACCSDPLKFCEGDHWKGNIEGFAKALVRLAAPAIQQPQDMAAARALLSKVQTAADYDKVCVECNDLPACQTDDFRALVERIGKFLEGGAANCQDSEGEKASSKPWNDRHADMERELFGDGEAGAGED